MGKPDETVERKPYEKPEVVHRQKLETLAQGACVDADPINGKTGTGDTCTFINS
jgi:hypothetical protein